MSTNGFGPLAPSLDERSLQLHEDIEAIMSPTHDHGGDSSAYDRTSFALPLDRFLIFWKRLADVELSTAFAEELMWRLADIEKVMAHSFEDTKTTSSGSRRRHKAATSAASTSSLLRSAPVDHPQSKSLASRLKTLALSNPSSPSAPSSPASSPMTPEFRKRTAISIGNNALARTISALQDEEDEQGLEDCVANGRLSSPQNTSGSPKYLSWQRVAATVNVVKSVNALTNFAGMLNSSASTMRHFMKREAFLEDYVQFGIVSSLLFLVLNCDVDMEDTGFLAALLNLQSTGTSTYGGGGGGGEVSAMHMSAWRSIAVEVISAKIASASPRRLALAVSRLDPKTASLFRTLSDNSITQLLTKKTSDSYSRLHAPVAPAYDSAGERDGDRSAKASSPSLMRSQVAALSSGPRSQRMSSASSDVQSARNALSNPVDRLERLIQSIAAQLVSGSHLLGVNGERYLGLSPAIVFSWLRSQKECLPAMVRVLNSCAGSGADGIGTGSIGIAPRVDYKQLCMMFLMIRQIIEHYVVGPDLCRELMDAVAKFFTFPEPVGFEAQRTLQTLECELASPGINARRQFEHDTTISSMNETAVSTVSPLNASAALRVSESSFSASGKTNINDVLLSRSHLGRNIPLHLIKMRDAARTIHVLANPHSIEASLIKESCQQFRGTSEDRVERNVTQGASPRKETLDKGGGGDVNSIQSIVTAHKISLLKLIDATLKVFHVKLSRSLFDGPIDADVPEMYRMLIHAVTVSDDDDDDDLDGDDERPVTDSAKIDKIARVRSQRRRNLLEVARQINVMAFNEESLPAQEPYTGDGRDDDVLLASAFNLSHPSFTVHSLDWSWRTTNQEVQESGPASKGPLASTLPASVCSDHLSEIIKDIIAVTASSMGGDTPTRSGALQTSTRPVLRYAIAGGDGTVHYVVNAWVKVVLSILGSMSRSTSSSAGSDASRLMTTALAALDMDSFPVDVRFTILPCGSESNSLSNYLCLYDDWYRNIVAAPILTHIKLVPAPLVALDSTGTTDSNSPVSGTSSEKIALPTRGQRAWTADRRKEMEEAGRGSAASAHQYSNPLSAMNDVLGDYVRSSDNVINVQVFKCECWSKCTNGSGGGTYASHTTIAFCSQLEIGAFVELELIANQHLHAQGPGAPVAPIGGGGGSGNAGGMNSSGNAGGIGIGANIAGLPIQPDNIHLAPQQIDSFVNKYKLNVTTHVTHVDLLGREVSVGVTGGNGGGGEFGKRTVSHSLLDVTRSGRSRGGSSGHADMSFIHDGDVDTDDDGFALDDDGDFGTSSKLSTSRETLSCSCLLLSNLPRHGSCGYHNDPTRDWLDMTLLEQEHVVTFNNKSSEQQEIGEQPQEMDGTSLSGGSHSSRSSTSSLSSMKAAAPARKFRSVEDIHYVAGHKTSLCRSVQIESVGTVGETIHVVVNGKKMRHKNTGQFYARIDGELYGPFYRLRISPYTVPSSSSSESGAANITFPIGAVRAHHHW